VHRLLRAEGVPVSRYQLIPLPEQKVFTERVGFGHGYPWRLAEDPPEPPCPVTESVLEDSLTLQKRHLNPQAATALARYADGFEKVWRHMSTVAELASEESR